MLHCYKAIIFLIIVALSHATFGAEKAAVTWVRYDNRWDFIKSPTIIENLVGTENSHPNFGVNKEDYFFIPARVPYENLENGPSFKDTFSLALKHLEGAKHPEFFLFLDSHGGQGFLCGQYCEDLRYEELAEFIFKSAFNFNEKNPDPVTLNIFCMACFSGSAIDVFKSKYEKLGGSMRINLFTSSSRNEPSYSTGHFQKYQKIGELFFFEVFKYLIDILDKAAKAGLEISLKGELISDLFADYFPFFVLGGHEFKFHEFIYPQSWSSYRSSSVLSNGVLMAMFAFGEYKVAERALVQLLKDKTFDFDSLNHLKENSNLDLSYLAKILLARDGKSVNLDPKGMLDYYLKNNSPIRNYLPTDQISIDLIVNIDPKTLSYNEVSRLASLLVAKVGDGPLPKQAFDRLTDLFDQAEQSDKLWIYDFLRKNYKERPDLYQAFKSKYNSIEKKYNGILLRWEQKDRGWVSGWIFHHCRLALQSLGGN